MELLDVIKEQTREGTVKRLLKFLFGIIVFMMPLLFLRSLMRERQKPEEILQFIFQFQHILCVLAAMVIWGISRIIRLVGRNTGKRYFLNSYNKLPEVVKQKLLYRFQEQDPGRPGICEADGYMLLRDILFFNTLQIVKVTDIVWMYYKNGMYAEYAELEKNHFTSKEGVYLLSFCMRDGSLHKAAVYGSLWETYMWFSERCSGAVWGYGKYQKIKVKEILKREAGRTALEEQTEAYHLAGNRAARLAAVENILIIMAFLLMLAVINRFMLS